MKGRKLKEKIFLFKIRVRKDPEAFAEIYDYYLKPIYRFIYFKVSSIQEAEDLSAEVFLKTWKYIGEENKNIDNIQAFLYQTARNLVIDYYRQKAKKEVVKKELENIEEGRDFLKEIEIKIEVKQIEKVLRGLKDEYREVLILRYLEELSIKEISQILGKSKGAIRVLLHRAIKAVREVAIQKNK